MDLLRTGFLLVDLGEVPESFDWLTPDESGVCQGLRLPGRRDDWRLGRQARRGPLAR